MSESRVVFLGANLVDGDNAPQPGSTVVVSGQRITEVSQGAVETGPEDEVIDLAGKTLMPGMVQCHFHAGFGPSPATAQAPILGLEAPAAFMGILGARNLQLALQTGVTSIIGSSNNDLLDVCLKEAMILGLFDGPRIKPCSREYMASGDMADGTNRSWFMGIDNPGLTRRMDGADAFRQAAREDIGRGCEVIKLSAGPGHGSAPVRDVCYLTQDELDAVVDIAHRHDALVRAHCPSRVGIIECARAGVDIIDHADRIDAEGIEACVKAGATICPSMLWNDRFLQFAESWDHSAAPFPIGEGFPEKLEDTLTRLRGVREDYEYTREILPEVVKSGVRLVVGDDFGFPMMPHGDYVSEYELYVKQIGIPALEVLRWATKNGAELMGRGDELGTIAPGKLADLLIVGGDPVADISCLRDQIVAVMKDGAWVRNAFAA